MAVSACEQPDWRSLYEQAHTRAEKERARADAAQARAEELRRAEVDSRSRAGSLKWQLDTCRNKLKAGAEQTKEVRRAAKDALFFQAEVARLETLLSQAGVESSKRSTIMSLRKENARLRKAVKASQARTESLEGQLARLRATGTVLSKALYGTQERAAGEAALRAPARSAARRRRPWPHAAPRARGTNRRAQSAEGCAGVFLLREALRGERRAFLDRHRDRSQGPHTQDRPSPVAPELRLRIVAPGSVGAPGGAAVPQHALRDQLLGTLPVRALCLLAAPAPRCRVAVRPGAGGLARDAGQHFEALRGAVRAGGRGDPRAPERGGAAPCRRDHLARAGASRGGSVEPGLAVDLGQQRRGLLPHRPEPQCRGGAQAVRRGHARYGHRLRPLQRLQEAGAPSRGTGDPCMVLEICCGRDYVAERQHPYVRREKPPNLRNIFF